MVMRVLSRPLYLSSAKASRESCTLTWMVASCGARTCRLALLRSRKCFSGHPPTLVPRQMHVGLCIAWLEEGSVHRFLPGSVLLFPYSACQQVPAVVLICLPILAACPLLIGHYSHAQSQTPIVVSLRS